MTREQLEHVIRAAAAISDTEDIVVIGSQSVRGQFPDAPAELLVSMAADVYPLRFPERGDLIDGSIGEGSPFQDSFGYYAHGVDDTTAILPEGWNHRLILVSGPNTRHARGWCLEIHDLAISKYAAGREKDLDYVRVLATRELTKKSTLLQRLAVTPLDDVRRNLALTRIRAHFPSSH